MYSLPLRRLPPTQRTSHPTASIRIGVPPSGTTVTMYRSATHGRRSDFVPATAQRTCSSAPSPGTSPSPEPLSYSPAITAPSTPPAWPSPPPPAPPTLLPPHPLPAH